MQAPGEALAAKLWETVAEKGIGGLFKPWQMRREGRAAADVRRDEILMLAQAEVDAEKIKQGLCTYQELSKDRLQRRDGASLVERIEPTFDSRSIAELCAEANVAEEIRGYS